MNLEILTPEKKLYSGEVYGVQMPGISGSFEVLDRHAPLVSALKAGRVKVLKDKQNHNENDRLAHHLQHLHDIRMVRPPEIQGITALDRDPGKLDDRVCESLPAVSQDLRRVKPVYATLPGWRRNMASNASS